jgi:Mce-associated membrane protein
VTPANDPTISKTDKEVAAVPVEADEATQDVTVESTAKEIDATTAVEAEPLGAAKYTGGDIAEGDIAAAAEKRRIPWSKVLAYGLIPVLALVLVAGAAYLWWQESKAKAADTARIEAVQTAKDSTVKLLSYKPDTVDQDLGSARDLLTGNFRDSYTQLTTDVVIPGSKEKKISAVANVPAIASVSADPNHAVVLVFVDQTVIVGDGAPTSTASSVQVTLDKVNGRWLISGFDPV